MNGSKSTPRPLNKQHKAKSSRIRNRLFLVIPRVKFRRFKAYWFTDEVSMWFFLDLLEMTLLLMLTCNDRFRLSNSYQRCGTTRGPLPSLRQTKVPWIDSNQDHVKQHWKCTWQYPSHPCWYWFEARLNVECKKCNSPKNMKVTCLGSFILPIELKSSEIILSKSEFSPIIHLSSTL